MILLKDSIINYIYLFDFMANKIKALYSLTARGPTPLVREGFFRVNGTEHYPVMYREIQSFVSDFMMHREKDRVSKSF
jgi:hypothetical protein